MHLGSEKAPGCQLEGKMTLGGGWTRDPHPGAGAFQHMSLGRAGAGPSFDRLDSEVHSSFHSLLLYLGRAWVKEPGVEVRAGVCVCVFCCLPLLLA